MEAPTDHMSIEKSYGNPMTEKEEEANIVKESAKQNQRCIDELIETGS